MFSVIITDTIYNKIIEEEKNNPVAEHANLYKILRKYEHQIITTEETEKLKNTPQDVLKHPSSLYILSITPDEASAIQQNYGVMCVSGDNPDVSALIDINDAFVANKYHKLERGWDAVLDSVETLPSNSLIIVDRYLFETIEPEEGDGFANIEVILDQLLPKQFHGGKYIITVMFNKDNQPLKFDDIAMGLEVVRKKIRKEYPIQMEVIGFDKGSKIYAKLHNRVIISNYYIVEAGHKIAAFDEDIATARQTIYPMAIFTESSLLGASSPPLRAIKQNVAAIKDFFKYVTRENKNYDKYAYALDGERKKHCTAIRNRLLK